MNSESFESQFYIQKITLQFERSYSIAKISFLGADGGGSCKQRHLWAGVVDGDLHDCCGDIHRACCAVVHCILYHRRFVLEYDILIYFICNTHFHWLKRRKICGMKILAN